MLTFIASEMHNAMYYAFLIECINPNVWDKLSQRKCMYVGCQISDNTVLLSLTYAYNINRRHFLFICMEMISNFRLQHK